MRVINVDLTAYRDIEKIGDLPRFDYFYQNFGTDKTKKLMTKQVYMM